MNCIIIDTNIIRKGSKLSFDELQKYVSAIGNDNDKKLFPEIVIDELRAYYERKFVTEELIFDNSIVLKEIMESCEKEKLYNQSKNYIDAMLAKISGNEVIPFDKTIELKEVYKRALTKIPPFIEKSDRGFKDTLIWLSILNFDVTNYESVFFLTNDGSFYKNREFLQTEYINKTGRDITILQKFDRDISDEDIKNSLLTKHNDDAISLARNATSFNELADTYSKLSILRDDLHEKLDALLFYRDNDWNGNEWDAVRFKMFAKLEPGIIDELINDSVEILDRNIFSENISPAELFVFSYKIDSEIPL